MNIWYIFMTFMIYIFNLYKKICKIYKILLLKILLRTNLNSISIITFEKTTRKKDHNLKSIKKSQNIWDAIKKKLDCVYKNFIS